MENCEIDQIFGQVKIGRDATEKENTVQSLFDIALNLVSRNIAFIDNLEGFPELIGSIIFKAIVQNGEFITNNTTATRIAEIFSCAYKDSMLSSLCLSGHLLVINMFFDPLVKFTTYLSELDLRSCHLGDNHAMIIHIGEMKSLKKLCLKDNCLTDYGIRKLTIPLRMFNKGLLKLEELDISENHDLSDVIISWLPKFKRLCFIDLSGTSLTGCGLLQLMKECDLTLSNDGFFPVRTEGWAALIMEQWVDFCQRKVKEKQKKSFKNISTFYSRSRKRRYLIHSSHQSAAILHHSQFILRKIQNADTHVCEKNVSGSVSSPDLIKKLELETKNSKRLKTIKENIFSQYL